MKHDFQVGDFLRFRNKNEKIFYCVVIDIFREGWGQVYWHMPAESVEPFCQTVNLTESFFGRYEKVTK